MAKKSTKGKPQTGKQPKRSNAPESESPRTAMQDFDAAVEAAKRHAKDVQSHAADGMKAAVKDVQKRQSQLQKHIADINKKTAMSADAKVAATRKALDDFDAFIIRVAAGIDRERVALSERASALRKQLDSLKGDAVKRTEKDYARAEKAVKDFDKFVERNAASLEKDFAVFIDRAELQLKSMRDAIALYAAKSAEMAQAGSSGIADLWKDLKHSQKNAQKHVNAFSRSSVRAWKDITKGIERAWSEIENAGQKAGSRYGDTTTSGASGKTKTGAKRGQTASIKSAKKKTGSGPSTQRAAPSTKKAAPKRRAANPAPKPAKS